jgi:hypothetical protein
LDAAYAFIDPIAAEWWRQHERKHDLGYLVEVAEDSAPFHIGDLLGVQAIEGVDASPEAAARRYWSAGKPTFTTPDHIIIKEFVTGSPLKVLSA